jgi:effector-binding domain-containing protein
MTTTLAPEFTVTHVPEVTFAYVVRSVGLKEVGEFIGGAVERVADFARAHGGTQGPPMSICSAPDENGIVVLEVGWPVEADTEPEAPVEVRTLPATVAIVHLHVGSYDDLPELYRELYAEAHARRYAPVGSPRERYLTAPGDGPPVTEIVWPIA